MIIFNQQQSAIVAQPMISHLQPTHPGLTIATQMQTGCQNQINDIQTVSESVTVQTKLVQQSITEENTISSHTEENLSISLDFCNTTISEPEKDLKQDFPIPEQILESEAIVSHDASNQTDLQTEDETYHPLTEESKENDFIESAQDCMDNGQSTQTMVLSIAENTATPDMTGLELLLNSIEQFEKRNSSERLDNNHQEIMTNKEESKNVQIVHTSANSIEETEEKGVNKIDLLLLAEQFLETEKSSEKSEQDNLQCYSISERDSVQNYLTSEQNNVQRFSTSEQDNIPSYSLSQQDNVQYYSTSEQDRIQSYSTSDPERDQFQNYSNNNNSPGKLNIIFLFWWTNKINL